MKANLDIKQSGLSVRTTNVLIREGVFDLYSLAVIVNDKGWDNLYIPGLGIKGAKQLRSCFEDDIGDYYLGAIDASKKHQKEIEKEVDRLRYAFKLIKEAGCVGSIYKDGCVEFSIHCRVVGIWHVPVVVDKVVDNEIRKLSRNIDATIKAFRSREKVYKF